MNQTKITLSTLRMFQEYHWLMLRVFFDASVARFGADGLEAVRSGVYACGQYRGQRMRDQPASLLSERNALSLIETWDTGEWELAAVDGLLAHEGTTADLSIHLEQPPGFDYFTRHDRSMAALGLYWPALMAGVTDGYGPGVGAVVTAEVEGRWQLRLVADGVEPMSRSLRLGGTVHDQLSLLRMSRRTSGLIAALQMYVSRELVTPVRRRGGGCRTRGVV